MMQEHAIYLVFLLFDHILGELTPFCLDPLERVTN
jgi:hypothetical protein